MVAVNKLNRPCDGCSTNDHETGQWWLLTGYYHISGYFCPECYNKVAHDSYGYPKDPVAYTYMIMKLAHNKEVA